MARFGLDKATYGLGGTGIFGRALHRCLRSSQVEYFFYRASKPMAEAFDVSVQAMRIRLEQLGLLLVDYARQQSLDFVA